MSESITNVGDAVAALGALPVPVGPEPRRCEACGSLPEDWCPDCAACEQGCFGGFDGNECSHSKAKWGDR